MAAKITDLLLMLLIFVSESRVIISAFNVVDFGANPDGETDSFRVIFRCMGGGLCLAGAGRHLRAAGKVFDHAS